MKVKSIWLDKIKFSKPKKLERSLAVDVLIVGGGMTGLSTAYHLMNSKLNVALVEQNTIAHGVSSRTTGKLTYLQDNIYYKLQEKASLYYDSQIYAINLVKNIIKKHKIACNFIKTPSYLFTNKISDISKIKEEQEMLKKLNVKFNICDDLPIKTKCEYAISVNDTYLFHPVKYLTAIKDIVEKNGVLVFENTTLTKITKRSNYFECQANDYMIKAKYVVMASHYPFFLKPLFVPIKTYLEKSYLSASATKENLNLSAITVGKPTISIRTHKDKNNYLIFLYKSHNICGNHNNKENFNSLIENANKHDFDPEYIWSNQDIMTEDNLPYIGFIDDNLLIGTGYNTWGMTNGSLAGKIMADLIITKKNKYQDLFNPKRNKSFINILKYPLNVTYNTKAFIDTKVIKNKKWYQNDVLFTKIDGKNVAIYTDEDNKEHIVYNLCPHLKCSLLFNSVEKTWDCPCHGSRFDIDGKRIFGPSCEDITYKR